MFFDQDLRVDNGRIGRRGGVFCATPCLLGACTWFSFIFTESTN